MVWSWVAMGPLLPFRRGRGNLGTEGAMPRCRADERSSDRPRGRPLVGVRGDLSDLSAILPGLGRRWRRGFARDRATARLSGRPRRRRDLAVADLPLADGRLRLRRRG